MPSEHDKIDTQKVITSLNTILELELAGMVRYVQDSLMVFGQTGSRNTPAGRSSSRSSTLLKSRK